MYLTFSTRWADLQNVLVTFSGITATHNFLEDIRMRSAPHNFTTSYLTLVLIDHTPITHSQAYLSIGIAQLDGDIPYKFILETNSLEISSLDTLKSDDLNKAISQFIMFPT